MKESFYFSHDYNARNDQKILMLRGKFGNEGYALFFYILETMAEESQGYIYRGAIGGLSVGYGVANDTLMAFIDFCLEKNLLKEDENGIYSIRMQQHKAARRLLSNKGKEGSKKRWEQAKKIAPPLAYKGKERKGKEKKEKEIDRESTPSQNMKDFILMIQSKNNLYEEFVSSVVTSKNFEVEIVQRELDKFVNYWTELNKSGTRQKWELQETFEISKRLTTWFLNMKNPSFSEKGKNVPKSFSFIS